MAFIRDKGCYLLIELSDNEQYMAKNNLIMIFRKSTKMTQKGIDNHFKATEIPEEVIKASNDHWYKKKIQHKALG